MFIAIKTSDFDHAVVGKGITLTDAHYDLESELDDGPIHPVDVEYYEARPINVKAELVFTVME